MAAPRIITIGRGIPTAADVLDYSIALIEEYGWNQMPVGDNPAAKEGKPTVESSNETGFTLHDSIGESCTRLSKAAEGAGGKGTKDWTVYEGDKAHNLRKQATALVAKHLPDGMNDQNFNDQAKSVDEVLDVLRKARAEVAT